VCGGRQNFKGGRDPIPYRPKGKTEMPRTAYPEEFSKSNPRRDAVTHLLLAAVQLEAEANLAPIRNSGKLRQLAHSLSMISVLLEEQGRAA
jgi:hypothetical protein